MEDTPTILIVLATYQGERFLEEQLRSIQQQSWTNWRLLVRDDGSSDGTWGLVQRLAAEDPRVEMLSDGETRLRALGNFSRLLAAALQRPWQWLAFADQDDFWLREKLSLQAAAMTAAEQVHPGRPTLVHSDLEVVDEWLQTRHRSLAEFAGLDQTLQPPLRRLLLANQVTGCSMLINRPLAELAAPVPDEAVMHDWWIAACAAAAGQVTYLSQPLVRYRQHGGNTIGTHSLWQALNPWRGWNEGRWRKSLAGFVQGQRQALALRERLCERGCELSDEAAELLERYCQIIASDKSGLSRWRSFRKLGVAPRNVARSAALLGRLLLATSAGTPGLSAPRVPDGQRSPR